MKKDYEDLKAETRANPDLELFTLQYEIMHHVDMDPIVI